MSKVHWDIHQLIADQDAIVPPFRLLMAPFGTTIAEPGAVFLEIHSIRTTQDSFRGYLMRFKRLKVGTSTQEQFMIEAREMFKEVQVNWEEYEEANPDVEMDQVKEYVRDVKGWNSIGFHRVLGAIFYDYGLSIVEMILGVVILPLMILVAMPYPSSEGYYSIAAGFFASLFTIFDFGTAYGLERFIGEYRIKNPKKMLGFMSFFIWYQMITGLVQVTVVSTFALFIFPGTDLAYAAWLFLILSTTQYPGMLGYFKSMLRGLQAFHFDNIVDFFRSNVFDLMTRILFILMFRWIGLNNPAIGDLMGLAIGSAIGRYVDEFINMALAIWLFNKVMKKQNLGIRARDCFNFRHIDWKVVKTAMWWGLQLSLPSMIGSLWGFASLMVTLQYLPQYAHWNTVAGIVSAVTRILTIGSKLSLTPAMAEAYMNGKVELAQFYMENAFKWYFTILFGILGLHVVFLPNLMTVILELPGAENYELAIPFLVPMIIQSIWGPLDGYMNGIMIGTNHPTAKTIIDILSQITGFTWHFFNYAILAWQVKFGINGIVMLYSFAGFAHWLAFFFIKWLFIEFYVFHVKMPKWQCVIAPILTTVLAIMPAGYAWLYGVYEPFLLPGLTNLMGESVGPIVAAAITLVLALVVYLFAIYLPVYAFLGGWDDFGLLVFRMAYHLSGPSKPLIFLMYKTTELGARWSKKTVKLHGRFGIESSIPYRQSIELLIERRIHDVRQGFASGLKPGYAPVEPEKGEKRESHTPRFYLTEFFKEFKNFFTKITPFQKRGIAFSASLYLLVLTPIGLISLGTGFFTPERVWFTWVFYLSAVIAIGIAGISYAIRYVKKHDISYVYEEHQEKILERE
ncbi:hypothetical protein GF325_11435 [Candidatus Bathyarchaeota archaeon]|nr:hypothetical protein [Candidatus Bathyarchaeota archaeon]